MNIGLLIWLVISFVNFAGNLIYEKDIIALLWLITILLSMIAFKLKEICDAVHAKSEGDKK
jgi:hypothetical protein